MIRTFTAWTDEVDDVGLAVEQIKSRLDLENRLLKNSVGIVACHYEFVHSGVFEAVCEALPFDVVGTISSGQSVPKAYDALMLTLMVITSDDTEFVTAMTPSLVKEPGQVIAESYKSACRAEKPALILTFAPFMLENSGDEYVNVISAVSGGVPCFGTIAVDETYDFANSYMLLNGQYYRDKMAMVLLYGNIQPKFYIANISPDKILEKSAIVTKSANHILMEVNGRPVVEYFEDLGLAQASETQYAMSSLPFLLDYNDGTPTVSKIFVSLTPEKYAICAGAMPEGSTLYLATSDKEDVLLTTGNKVEQMLQEIDGASVLLIYSCISRSMTFGAEQFQEIELLDEKIGDKIPFMMVFSGGEICPTAISEQKAINRFHNNAFIACVF